MARTLRKPLPEDVDFMHASREEMAELRKAIYPTRKLAVRLAEKGDMEEKVPLTSETQSVIPELWRCSS